MPASFVWHSLLFAVAVFAVALPAYDAVAKKRLGSWVVVLLVFPLISFGLFGIEEMFFVQVWPSYLAFLIYGAGLLLALLYRAVMFFIDRKRTT